MKKLFKQIKSFLIYSIGVTLLTFSALNADTALVSDVINVDRAEFERLCATVSPDVRKFDNTEGKPFYKPYLFSISIPKSGTHLLGKCLRMMRPPNIREILGFGPREPKKESDVIVKKERSPKSPEGARPCQQITKEAFKVAHKTRFLDRFTIPGWKRSFHLTHSSEYEEFLTNLTSGRALFLIRDPRDQLVSFVKWVCPQESHGTQVFDDMLLDFIDGKMRKEQVVVRMFNSSNVLWSFGIGEYYKMYTPWMKAKSVHTIYFENLVGEQGGGSLEAQLREIDAIANHLKITLTADRKQRVLNDLFGGTSTFNKGMIGTWKKYFKPEHKQACKESVAGQLLIDLGYEKDLNW